MPGPFSASAVGDSFGKCGKGGPLPVDETAHIGSVSLNSIGRRAIFVKMLKKRIFSLIIVKIFTKSNSKYLYYANILKRMLVREKCRLICNACEIWGKTMT